MVLTICLLIGLQPTVNFGNQRNLRISRLFASRLLTNLLVARAMHDFQEQCQNVFHTMLCSSFFLQTMLLLHCPINANIRADDSQSYSTKYKLLPDY